MTRCCQMVTRFCQVVTRHCQVTDAVTMMMMTLPSLDGFLAKAADSGALVEHCVSERVPGCLKGL